MIANRRPAHKTIKKLDHLIEPMSVARSDPHKSRREISKQLLLEERSRCSSDIISIRTDENSATCKLPSSRSFPERATEVHALLQSVRDFSTSSQVSTPRGRSAFVPMDAASLDASIKKENSCLRRSHSPLRERHRRPSGDEKEFNHRSPHVSDRGGARSRNNDNDDLGLPIKEHYFDTASDDEDPGSYLLGVSTPRTIRGMKLRISLDPVRESEDEYLDEWNQRRRQT